MITVTTIIVNDMAGRETINGTPVTEEQITAWADEAEAGYDVAALKKRGRGRPGRGVEPSQVVALRLTVDELAALDARAESEGKSRFEVIREALASTSVPKRRRKRGIDPEDAAGGWVQRDPR